MQFRPEVARRSPVEQSVENIAVDVIQLVTKGVIGQPEIGVLTHGSKVIARQPHAIASSAWGQGRPLHACSAHQERSVTDRRPKHHHV